MDGQEAEKEEVTYLEWKRQSFRKRVNIKKTIKARGVFVRLKKPVSVKKPQEEQS